MSQPMTRIQRKRLVVALSASLNGLTMAPLWLALKPMSVSVTVSARPHGGTERDL